MHSHNLSPSSIESLPLIEVKQMTKTFFVKKKALPVLSPISFNIYPKETFALVGESGSAKTTIGRLLLQIYKPTSGEIFFAGNRLDLLSKKEKKTLALHMQYIFQDPFASLNPRMTAGEILAEPFKIHRKSLGNIDWKKKVHDLLHLVGLNPEHTRRFPHEFSGGQRQRICIARALALNPRFIVCDEPIAALDVSIQSQIVNLLKKLQRELGLTYLFISHDLSMVSYLANRIAVMYLGHLVELASNEVLSEEPLHPYTEALLSSVPDPDPKRKTKRIILKGELPSYANLPKGCPFASRCPKVMPLCHEKKPPLIEVKKNHLVACHLFPTALPS